MCQKTHFIRRFIISSSHFYKSIKRIFLSALIFLVSGCGASTSNDCTLASYFNVSGTDEMRVCIGDSDLGGTAIAQSFILTRAGTSIWSRVELKKTGFFSAGTQSLTASIQTNINNAPSQIILATSNSIDASAISNAFASSYYFIWTQPPVLSASEIYWLVIRVTYPNSSINYISWSAFNTLLSTEGYSVNSIPLSSVYQTGLSFFSSARTGRTRFLFFSIGC